jgi:Skp family chaperone for outer membrane proteins
VKRCMIFVGGLLALATTAYIGSRLWAQGTGAPAAPAQTRVAFINIETVFQNYQKAVVYKKEMEKLIEPFKAKADKLKAEILQWQRDLQDVKMIGNKNFNKEQWEAGIVKNKRDLEDLGKEVGQIIGKKNEEQVVQLYKEVNEKVQAVALDRGFQVVMCYGESTKLPPLGYENISRKVQGMEGSGCTSFMYIAPGLDISQAVIDLLNRSYPGGSTATTGGGSGVTPVSGQK